MPVWARPVRIFCKSFFSDSIERPIFCSAVFLISAIVMMSGPESLDVDERALVLSLHDALERARLEDAEYADRQLLVAAERKRGRIDHLAVLDDRLVEADPRVACRVRILLRVGAVDTVDLGRLQHDLGADLGAEVVLKATK